MGACYSIISGATHKQLCPQKRLMPTTVKLRTYTVEPLAVKESVMAHVHYGDKEVKLSLLLLTDYSLSLLDQDWLLHLKLDWQLINILLSEVLQQVMQRHEYIFQDGLGTLEGYMYKAKIHIITGVSPRFL